MSAGLDLQNNLEVKQSNKVWIPILPTSNVDSKYPIPVTVAGVRLVAWKSAESNWSVMSDVCPHRLAPLSQGRVDLTSGCIECP